MKLKALIVGIISLSGFSVNSYASEEGFRKNLVEIKDELNVILTIIEKAKKQQEPNSTVTFNLVSKPKSNTKGLRDDIVEMKAAISSYLNAPSQTPKKLQPLSLDYIRGDK